jgi:hypothetical protein
MPAFGVSACGSVSQLPAAVSALLRLSSPFLGSSYGGPAILGFLTTDFRRWRVVCFGPVPGSTAASAVRLGALADEPSPTKARRARRPARHARARVVPETVRSTDFAAPVTPGTHPPMRGFRDYGLSIYVPLWRDSGSPVCRKTMRARRRRDARASCPNHKLAGPHNTSS